MADLAKLVDDLSALTVLEASELSKMLEEKWGVSAAAAVAQTPESYTHQPERFFQPVSPIPVAQGFFQDHASTAAEADTATGGVDRSGKIFPIIKIVSRVGITTVPEQKIAAVFKRNVA